MSRALDFSALGGYCGGVNPRELAEALMSGRARIVGVDYDLYTDPYNERRSPGRTLNVQIQIYDTRDYDYRPPYPPYDRQARREMAIASAASINLDALNDYAANYKPGPDPKLMLEKLIKLTQIAVLAWADSLDEATKRTGMLELK